VETGPRAAHAGCRSAWATDLYWSEAWARRSSVGAKLKRAGSGRTIGLGRRRWDSVNEAWNRLLKAGIERWMWDSGGGGLDTGGAAVVGAGGASQDGERMPDK
jgi:hypothetical protein